MGLTPPVTLYFTYMGSRPHSTDCYHCFAYRLTLRLTQLCKISYRSVKGLRCGGGPKIACSHRKAESSITLHCTTVHAVIFHACDSYD
jgi:hypothetical protein